MLQFSDEAAMPASSTTGGEPEPDCCTCIVPEAVLTKVPGRGNLRVSMRTQRSCRTICSPSTAITMPNTQNNILQLHSDAFTASPREDPSQRRISLHLV